MFFFTTATLLLPDSSVQAKGSWQLAQSSSLSPANHILTHLTVHCQSNILASEPLDLLNAMDFHLQSTKSIPMGHTVGQLYHLFFLEDRKKVLLTLG